MKGEYPLINVLIRTSNRPKQFARCLKSVAIQNYPNLRVIVSYDTQSRPSYIPITIETVNVAKGTGKFFYNLYCNDLKDMIYDGYMHILDDDDIYLPGALKKIAEYLSEDAATICQFKRGSIFKPSGKMIEDGHILSGKIGMPCIFLHHKHLKIANFTDDANADYAFIKDVSEQIACNFVAIPVVHSPYRGFGKMG